MLENLKNYILNIPGWNSKSKFIVFESDDWGTIRTRSRQDLKVFQQHGINVENCNYMSNDSLASDTDVSHLMERLHSYRDSFDNHPIFTMNCLMANPNFKKIKESNFETYFFEDMVDTLSSYPNHTNAFDLWLEGKEKNLFQFQSHGREHLNISRWMRDLRAGVKETRMAFDMEMFGVSGHLSKVKRGSYLAAYDGGKNEEIYNKKEIIEDALRLFEAKFKYKSRSFISPNYVWDENIEEALSKNGVRYIQGSRAQQISSDFGDKSKVKRHYLGQKNNFNQIYLVRNCFFEPSVNQDFDWVNSCLRSIEISFNLRKPAIISTHRSNYVGHINENNRDRSLLKLDLLLRTILEKWPDVAFITSDRLGKLIQDK